MAKNQSVTRLRPQSARKSDSLKQQHHKLKISLRLFIVWGVLVLGAVGLASRLYYLQIINPIIVYEQAPRGRSLREIARGQQTDRIKFYTPRRQIVDRNQNVLATDRITYELYVHPKLFRRNSKPVPPEEIAKDLADILRTKTPEEFLELFRKRKTGIRLANNLPESARDKIARLRIDGLDLRPHYSRLYPHEYMVAEIVGYINKDSNRSPQAGIEYTQDHLLNRKQSSVKVKRSFIHTNGQEQKIFHLGDLNPSTKLFQFDSLQLQLTVDLRLQQAVRAALKTSMDKYDAKRGTVIVMDVRDGSIRALVCDPTYNPNRYSDYAGDFSIFRNWAITDLYEPGSTFKPINIAIALDAGVISPEDTFDDTGKIEIGDRIVRNHDYRKKGAKGDINITQILQYSSNVGMIKIMNLLEPEDYYERLQNLGIEEPLHIEINGYTPGHLKDKIEFITKEIEVATTAFGQGLSLTPLKLVQLQAAIANGGYLVTPHLVQGLSDFEGNSHYSKTFEKKQVFSTKTTQEVLAMMEQVVEDGSGYNSKIANYRIAGKTGTAQKINPATGRYDKEITSFVGIFPVEQPRYVILAVVDEPQGQYTFGSTVAAPVVRSVIEALIAIEGIPPASQE
ncbi:MAG: penicillin-binding protein 2 [Xenococcaceae cyanobacterium MO_207.B15]|nr:penicillin-binding protein 2 [Xenococcaceae cyanobacterium MO_207.B15]